MIHKRIRREEGPEEGRGRGDERGFRERRKFR